MHMHMFSNTTTKTQPLRLTGVGLLRPGCSSQGRRQVVNRGSKNSGGLGGCGNPPPPPPWQTHWICTTVTSATGRRWGSESQDSPPACRRPYSSCRPTNRVEALSGTQNITTPNRVDRPLDETPSLLDLPLMPDATSHSHFWQHPVQTNICCV